MISQYNVSSQEEAYGVKNLTNVVSKRLKMQGFIVSDPDMGPAHAADHQKNVQKWSKFSPDLSCLVLDSLVEVRIRTCDSDRLNCPSWASAVWL